MSKIVFVICCTLLLSNVLTADFEVKNHYMSITTSVPPALIVVTDANGKKSGMDVMKPVDQFGQGSSIVEIPGSDVGQENTGSDEPPLNQPQEQTGWRISFMDQPAQRYVVHLTGVKTGVFTIGFSSGNRSTPARPQKIKFLTSKGLVRSINVDYNPNRSLVVTTPLLIGGDFLKDTQIACGLGAISPPEACDTLKDLASEVEKSRAEGKFRKEAEKLEAYLSILNRLHNWGQKGCRKDWEDFKGRPECDRIRKKGLGGTKFFAKDPAYSALKLDVETLLKTLPNGGRGKDSRGDEDHRGNGRPDGDDKR